MPCYDVIRFLKDYNIEFKERGKNIGKDSVGIKCFNCDDPSYHLGVHRQLGIFHCWRCTVKGNFIRLISELLNIPYGKAKLIASEYKTMDEVETHPNIIKSDRVIFPNYVMPLMLYNEKSYKMWKYATNFVKSRNVPFEVAIDWFYCYAGDWNGYLIIPITLNKQIVTYVGRRLVKRVYNRKLVRYRNARREHSVLPISHCLFNIDNVKTDYVILCEGIFDVFACGYKRSVAMFKKRISKRQIDLLLNKKLLNVYLCIDADVSDTDMLYNLTELRAAGINARTIDLRKYKNFGKDPAEIGPTKMNDIILNEVGSYGKENKITD